MAKKKSATESGKVNKSQEIRDYYGANPKAKPLEVVAAMKEKGIEVNAQFVSTVKSNSKKKPTTRKSTKAPAKKSTTSKRVGRPPATTGGAVTFDSLIKAKQLIEEMGGIDGARSAIAAYEQLLD